MGWVNKLSWYKGFGSFFIFHGILVSIETKGWNLQCQDKIAKESIKSQHFLGDGFELGE